MLDSESVFKAFCSLFVAGALCLSLASNSQAQSAQNAIYLELAGNGALYTLNYDRLVTDNVSVRAGAMTMSLDAADGDGSAGLLIAPLMGNYFIGDGSHKLELGAGPALVRATASTDFGTFDESGTTVFGTATAGYRFQPNDGGFVFRIGFTPLFGSTGFLPWGGLSLGYSF